jgi:hypothetical protein
MAQVRSSAEVEGGTLVFTALPLRESALLAGRIVACAADRTHPLSQMADKRSDER